MLQAQVNYWNLQEQKRHNLASESLEGMSLEETRRHNKTFELIEFQRIDETKRHNVISEQQSGIDVMTRRMQAQETARHNVVEESIGWANAYNQGTQASAAMMNARTNAYTADVNADLGYRGLEQNETRLNLQSRELGVKQQEADTHQYKAEMDTLIGASRTAISGVESAFGILRGVQIAGHTYNAYSKK